MTEISSTPRPRWRRRFWRSVKAVGAISATIFTFLVVTNLMVTRSIDGLGYDDAKDVPVKTVAIVFGAAVVNGQPTPTLADRVDGGVALFKAGKVSRLLLSGDNSREGYDEVTAMREQAMAAGVPASAITRDYAGFNTYESCYRARDVFGVRDAVLVTQDYHLSRALFTCRELGIDVVGLRLADWQHNSERLTRGEYTIGMSTSYMGREWLARLNAVIATKITHPEPKFVGPFIGLTET